VPVGVERSPGRDDLRLARCAADHPGAELAVRNLGQQVVPAVRGYVHLDHRAADRVLRAAALLRPRPARRRHEGLTYVADLGLSKGPRSPTRTLIRGGPRAPEAPGGAKRRLEWGVGM